VLGGIKRQHISAMEGGKRQIGRKMAGKLADYFDVSRKRFL
jgi:plasmid maintenance system antidote protein VapI